MGLIAERGGHREIVAWLRAPVDVAVIVSFLIPYDRKLQTAKIIVLARLGEALQAPLPPLSGYRLHPDVVGGTCALMAWAPTVSNNPPAAGGGRRRMAGTARIEALAALLVSFIVSSSSISTTQEEDNVAPTSTFSCYML